MSEKITLTRNSSGCDPFVEELQKLLACYQLASEDERRSIWLVLNKYLPYIKE